MINTEPGWSHLVGQAVDGRRLGWARSGRHTPADVVSETVRFHRWVVDH